MNDSNAEMLEATRSDRDLAVIILEIVHGGETFRLYRTMTISDKAGTEADFNHQLEMLAKSQRRTLEQRREGDFRVLNVLPPRPASEFRAPNVSK